MSGAATQSAVRRAKLSEEHEPVTLCIPFEASPPCLEVLTNWQQTQIPLYHSAFNRLLDQASAAGEISLPKTDQAPSVQEAQDIAVQMAAHAQDPVPALLPQKEEQETAPPGLGDHPGRDETGRGPFQIVVIQAPPGASTGLRRMNQL